MLGAETVRRLPPGTVVERLPELRVKGKAEPVEAYVLRALPAKEALEAARLSEAASSRR